MAKYLKIVRSLCIADLESARLLAAFINRVLPETAPLWKGE